MPMTLKETRAVRIADNVAWNAMRWRDQETHLAETVKALGAAIVPHLDRLDKPGWELTIRNPQRASEDSPSYALTNDIERIDLDIRRDERGKLHISGTVPNDNPDNTRGMGAGVSIQVTHSRGPEVIAKEIVRRFLGDYRGALDTAIMKRQAVTEYRDAVAQNKVTMLAAFKETDSKNYGPERFHIYGGPDGGYGDVNVSRHSVSLNLHSLPVPLALEIAAVYMRYKGGK